MAVVFSLAVRYLVSRLRQSLLTIAGIMIGVLALTLNQSLMGGFQQNFVDATLSTSSHITVRRKPIEPFDPTSPTRRMLRDLQTPLIVQTPRPPLPEEEEEIRNADALQVRIRAVSGVVATAPVAAGQALMGYAGFWEPVTVNGVLPSQQSQVVEFASKFVEGQVADLERDQNGIALGYLLAERLRIHVGDRVVLRATDGTPISLRVVALYRSNIYDIDNTNVWINLRRAQAVLGLGASVNAIQIRTADYQTADQTAQQIEYAIGMDAESWMEANQNILGLLRMIITIQFLVAFFTMMVAGFGIAGNLITTISEKTFDIGVLKAMGMPARRISLVFILLALMMIALGLLLGLPAAYMAIEALSRVPLDREPQPGGFANSETWPMLKSWTIYAVSGGFALIIGGLAALSPANRAAQMEPLNIIRNSAG